MRRGGGHAGPKPGLLPSAPSHLPPAGATRRRPSGDLPGDRDGTGTERRLSLRRLARPIPTDPPGPISRARAARPVRAAVPLRRLPRTPIRGRIREERRIGQADRERGESPWSAVVNLKREPKLREAFEYAHVHNNTVLIDRRTKWGNPFRIGPDGTASWRSRATAPISGAASVRARSRSKNSRHWTAAGSPAGAIRCPAMATSWPGQRAGRLRSWRSGRVRDAFRSHLAVAGTGSSGDAFGPGYPLQSPVAARPAISAPIPIALYAPTFSLLTNRLSTAWPRLRIMWISAVSTATDAMSWPVRLSTVGRRCGSNH